MAGLASPAGCVPSPPFPRGRRDAAASGPSLKLAVAARADRFTGPETASLDRIHQLGRV